MHCTYRYTRDIGYDNTRGSSMFDFLTHGAKRNKTYLDNEWRNSDVRTRDAELFDGGVRTTVDERFQCALRPYCCRHCNVYKFLRLCDLLSSSLGFQLRQWDCTVPVAIQGQGADIYLSLPPLHEITVIYLNRCCIWATCHHRCVDIDQYLSP